jgi:DNA-binding CsgD family transcriptional regulator
MHSKKDFKNQEFCLNVSDTFLKKDSEVRTMIKKIKNGPGWLGLSSDRTSFVFMPERAEIVKKIFELSISGFGGRMIARLLNEKTVPGFGASGRWDQSTIHNMLTSRATIGEFQRKQIIEGKEEPVGEPIRNYYPAVISHATFEAAQKARRHNFQFRSGRRGKAITNLFFGVRLLCHYCSQAVKFDSNGADKRFVCATVLGGVVGCPRFAWNYSDFEKTFFECLDVSCQYPVFSERLAELGGLVENKGDTSSLDARMHIASFLRNSVEKVVIAVAGSAPPLREQHLVVRSDYQSRFFEAKFFDGFLLRGQPRITSRTREITGKKISPDVFEKNFALSPRQAEITSLLVEGYTLKEAAERLSQSFETSRWHLREIFRRTKTHSQPELVDLAQRICSQSESI